MWFCGFCDGPGDRPWLLAVRGRRRAQGDVAVCRTAVRCRGCGGSGVWCRRRSRPVWVGHRRRLAGNCDAIGFGMTVASATVTWHTPGPGRVLGVDAVDGLLSDPALRAQVRVKRDARDPARPTMWPAVTPKCAPRKQPGMITRWPPCVTPHPRSRNILGPWSWRTTRRRSAAPDIRSVARSPGSLS